MTQEKKQTAVQWLQSKMPTLFKDLTINKELFQQALAMEKEQMMDAFNIGMKFSEDYFDNKNLEAEKYYNETYGK